MASNETKYTTITMDDGRVVEFAGKRKMLKSSDVKTDEHGNLVVQTRIDFLNGETRLFSAPASLIGKLAAHGAEQKLGDEIAGLDDIDDCILAVDELMARLEAGEWGVKREANGLAGTSVLAKALIEVTGKAPQVIREFLKAKSQAEKVALRSNPTIKPIIDRLEASKVRKPSSIDTNALLAGLGVDAPIEAGEEVEANAVPVE